MKDEMLLYPPGTKCFIPVYLGGPAEFSVTITGYGVNHIDRSRYISGIGMTTEKVIVPVYLVRNDEKGITEAVVHEAILEPITLPSEED